MYELIRDSALGHLIRIITKNRILLHPDEIPGFELPPTRDVSDDPSGTTERRDEVDLTSDRQSESSTDVEESSESKKDIEKGIEEDPAPAEATRTHSNVDHERNSIAIQKTISRPIHPSLTSDGTVLITWYTTDDPENPQNWTLAKKVYVSFVISMYTFAVYIGSSIYAPGEQGVMDEFDVGHIAAALGLSLYVLAYGIGPMIWSPLSEIPAIGRNPPYVATFAIFVILTIPSALTKSFAGLLVSRFLLGFFGSPCLATAGASFQDMFSLLKMPYLMMVWAGAATFGPAIGPVVAGFAVQAESWRWTQWEMLWLSGPIFIVMFLSLPETSAPAILYQRAHRLRKTFGNTNIKSQSEIDQKNMSARDIAFEALIKPWEINALDPAVLFSTVYISLLYGIFYSFFESTPLVYPVIYHFDLGESGLPFLSVLVALFILAAMYGAYWHFCVERPFPKKGFGPPEDRLLVGLVGSCMIPVGLFLYGTLEYLPAACIGQ